MKKTYEILLTGKYVEPKSWINFILEIGKLNGKFKKYTIWVQIENNYVRYFIQTKREIPTTLNTLGEFLIRKIDEKIDISCKNWIPYIITKGYKKILEIYDKNETKYSRNLFLTKINIYSHKKDNYLSTTKLYFKKENKKIVAQKAFFNEVPEFLSIDFDKHMRFFYKKDEEQYLDIRKTIHIFKNEKNNAILEINAFPYLQNKLYLSQNNYDFAKHSMIVGASGTGKSKLISTLIKNTYNNIENKLKYKIIVIDPHAAIEQDIGGLNEARVIDFKTIEDSIDLFVNTSEDIIATTEAIMGLFKTIIADQYNSKLERVLRYSIHILLANEKFNLITLRKLLTETEYRNQIIKKSQDIVVDSIMQFFLVDFNRLKTESYQEAISPIISFIDEMQILPVFNNKEKIENMQDVIENNFLTIFSLDQTTIGEKTTKTIAGFAMQQILQLVQAKALEEHVILIVDEVSIIENPILCRFLSESRKYNLSLILCQQYFDQISNELQKAILTNVINYFIFRVSIKDALTLEQNMNMEVAVKNSHRVRIKLLTQLSNRECIVRVCDNGVVLSAFKARTLDYIQVPRKRREKNHIENKTKIPQKEKTKGKFRIGEVSGIKDIMSSQSSGRRRLNDG